MAGDRVAWFENGKLDLRAMAPAEPGPGEVRYRVRAFALNRSELLFMDDSHYVPRRNGVRLGYEASGIVDAVGEGVTAFRIGDHVCSLPFASDAYGVNGGWAITPAEWLAPWPDIQSAEEACSAWMQYLTAYYPLFELAPIASGQAMLITAASSSAAIGACQMAKLAGARTIALTTNEGKADRLRSLGYDAVVATRGKPDLSREIETAAQGRPIGLSYDAVCGDLVGRYIGGLAKGATIFAYGNLSGDPIVGFPLIEAVRRDIRVHAYSTPNFSHDPLMRGRAVAFIRDLLESGQLRPVIGKIFPFDDALEAYDYLRAGQQIGKVVVSVGS